MSQIEKDLKYCIEECGMSNDQISLFMKAANELGVNCQYLAEEFVFETNSQDEFNRLHLDPEYLQIKWRLG